MTKLVVKLILVSSGVLAAVTSDKSFAFAPIAGGEVQLYSFPSPSVFDAPLPIELTRNNSMATGVRLTTNNLDDYVLFYGPGGSIVQRPVPDQDRLISLAASNWGVAVSVDQNGGTPSVTYAAPFGQPLSEIFRGTPNGSQTKPAISDVGTIGFASRDTNHHGLRDLNIWRPGASVMPSPDLGEDQLGDFVFIDGQQRFIVTQRFTPEPPISGLWRYELTSGWQNLTENWTPRVTELAGETAKASNLAGDIVFPTSDGSHYILNLYRAATGAIIPIADFTRQIPNQFPGTRRIDVSLADTGELLAVIGGTTIEDASIDVLFRKPSGDAIDLTSVLPMGESLAAYPARPQIAMSYLGRLLIESRNNQTALWSYHYFDYKTGEFTTPAALKNLQQRLEFSSISDDKRAYFWRDEGSVTKLISVTIPEPGAMLLAVCAATAVLRRRRASN